MPGARIHIMQIRYFPIVTALIQRDDQFDIAAGQISDQSPYDRNSRVTLIAHAEDDLIFRIVLQAKAGEIVIGFRVCARHWLEDSNRRRVVQSERALFSTIAEPGEAGEERE